MTEASHRPGITPLTVAWLSLLAVVTAGSTYLVLAHQALAPDELTGLTLAIPGPQKEDSGVAPAGGTPDDAASESEEPPASPVLAPTQVTLAEGADLPAWRRYASVYQATTEQPRIAVVLTGLGFSSRATKSAIEDLPPGVTLSFTPYVQKLPQWIAMARGNGHEVMLDLPMEPVTYPDDDPGPQALLTQLDQLQNQQRLQWVIARAEGYVGLVATMGSRFTGSEPHVKPVLEQVKAQGLMFLDNRSSEDSVVAAVAQDLGLPHAVNNRTLDEGDVGRLTIDARLAQIERLALNDGASIAIGRPYPATLERLGAWVKTLEARGPGGQGFRAGAHHRARARQPIAFAGGRGADGKSHERSSPGGRSPRRDPRPALPAGGRHHAARQSGPGLRGATDRHAERRLADAPGRHRQG
jgi:polysaccharide deacetylase 2 family uncharacterized protein YibQ